MQSKLSKLAQWSQMPGHDFDKPWAFWLLGEGRFQKMAYGLWVKIIEKPLTRICCFNEAHYVIDDHCGKLEHRYCVVCQKQMPNSPLTER